MSLRIFNTVRPILSKITRPTLSVRLSSDDISSKLYDEQTGGKRDFDNLPESESGQYNDYNEGQQYNAGQNYQGQPPYPQQQQRRTMNKGINRVELLGGVAGDPFIKTTQRGSDFASFNLYTNVDRRLNNGEFSTNVEVHNVVGFGGIAKYIKNNLQRGSRVYLVGTLHYNGGQLMADGTRSARTASVKAEHIYPLARSQRRQQEFGSQEEQE